MWLIIKELFSGLKGQVIFNGHISSSFGTSQRSGQGRILAPFLYKVYINQLLMELCQLDIGITFFNYSLSAPSFGDDITLLACFPSCLNIMIQLAYKYSCNSRYQFNYGKTGVVVFGECAVNHSKNTKVRQWKVGPNHIKSEYLIWVSLKTVVDLLIKILMRTSPRPEKSRKVILCWFWQEKNESYGKFRRQACIPAFRTLLIVYYWM